MSVSAGQLGCWNREAADQSFTCRVLAFACSALRTKPSVVFFLRSQRTHYRLLMLDAVKLTLAEPRDLAGPIAFSLRFESRRRVR
jgi:hypothetical protein